MGLVEAVTGEFLHQVEDVTRQIGVDIVSGATLNETATLLGHFLWLLLTHRATQHVGAAQGIARHHLSNLHHLFLIQDDAVGRRQYWLEAFILVIGMRVRQLGTPVLTVDEVIHHA